MKSLWIFLMAASLLPAQQSALLSVNDSLELFRRNVQLMESTMVAVPELARAGAPIKENIAQAIRTLDLGASRQHVGVTYSLLTNLRAYLALADAVPKPYPFPEEARRQFAELRDGVSRTEAHFQALLDLREAAIRNPDRDNLRRYAEANSRVSPPVPNNFRVVFFGDSITDGWRLNEYFPDRDFINRGISGQITGEMLGRMKADVIDLKPDAVLILAGTNDIARGVPPAVIQNNLSMMADLAVFHKIKPIFASILPVSDHHKDKNPRFAMTGTRPPATIRQLNDWLRRMCEQRGLIYLDYFSQMVDAAGFLQAELADDGLHPNSAGYRVMAPLALAAIDRAAGGSSAPPSQRRRRLFGGNE